MGASLRSAVRHAMGGMLAAGGMEAWIFLQS